LLASAPVGALLVVLLGWVLGSLLGGFLAAWIGGNAPVAHALVLGGLLTPAGIANNLMLPPPARFWVPTLVVLLPAAYAGARLAPRKAQSTYAVMAGDCAGAFPLPPSRRARPAPRARAARSAPGPGLGVEISCRVYRPSEAEKPPPPLRGVLRVAEQGDGWGCQRSGSELDTRGRRVTRAHAGVLPDRARQHGAACRRVGEREAVAWVDAGFRQSASRRRVSLGAAAHVSSALDASVTWAPRPFGHDR